MKLKTFMGENVEGAYKRYLERQSAEQAVKKPENKNIIQGIDRGNYIFMPQHDLYISKERSHLKENWFEAHKLLQKENARMLTLREFVDFLTLLKNGNAEFKNIYNDITEVGDPYRAEWIDADFKVVNNQLVMHYNHRLFGNELKPQNSEQLEKCLMEDCTVDIVSFNKQGLPTKKGNDFSYWYPRSDNNSVAGFVADSVGAGLDCDRDPRNSGAELGVRAARAKI